MTSVIAATASCLITALVGGVVGLLFWKIEKKIDHLEEDNERHHQEQVKVRTAERELLLAVADTSLLTAKKVNDEASGNGELKKAEDNLIKKRDSLQGMTRQIAIEYLEEAQ